MLPNSPKPLQPPAGGGSSSRNRTRRRSSSSTAGGGGTLDDDFTSPTSPSPSILSSFSTGSSMPSDDVNRRLESDFNISSATTPTATTVSLRSPIDQLLEDFDAAPSRRDPEGAARRLSAAGLPSPTSRSLTDATAVKVAAAARSRRRRSSGSSSDAAAAVASARIGSPLSMDDNSDQHLNAPNAMRITLTTPTGGNEETVDMDTTVQTAEETDDNDGELDSDWDLDYESLASSSSSTLSSSDGDTVLSVATFTNPVPLTIPPSSMLPSPPKAPLAVQGNDPSHQYLSKEDEEEQLQQHIAQIENKMVPVIKQWTQQLLVPAATAATSSSAKASLVEVYDNTRNAIMEEEKATFEGKIVMTASVLLQNSGVGAASSFSSTYESPSGPAPLAHFTQAFSRKFDQRVQKWRIDDMLRREKIGRRIDKPKRKQQAESSSSSGEDFFMDDLEDDVYAPRMAALEDEESSARAEITMSGLGMSEHLVQTVALPTLQLFKAEADVRVARSGAIMSKWVTELLPLLCQEQEHNNRLLWEGSMMLWIKEEFHRRHDVDLAESLAFFELQRTMGVNKLQTLEQDESFTRFHTVVLQEEANRSLLALETLEEPFHRHCRVNAHESIEFTAFMKIPRSLQEEEITLRRSIISQHIQRQENASRFNEIQFEEHTAREAWMRQLYVAQEDVAWEYLAFDHHHDAAYIQDIVNASDEEWRHTIEHSSENIIAQQLLVLIEETTSRRRLEYSEVIEAEILALELVERKTFINSILAEWIIEQRELMLFALLIPSCTKTVLEPELQFRQTVLDVEGPRFALGCMALLAMHQTRQEEDEKWSRALALLKSDTGKLNRLEHDDRVGQLSWEEARARVAVAKAEYKEFVEVFIIPIYGRAIENEELEERATIHNEHVDKLLGEICRRMVIERWVMSLHHVWEVEEFHRIDLELMYTIQEEDKARRQLVLYDEPRAFQRSITLQEECYRNIFDLVWFPFAAVDSDNPWHKMHCLQFYDLKAILDEFYADEAVMRWRDLVLAADRIDLVQEEEFARARIATNENFTFCQSLAEPLARGALQISRKERFLFTVESSKLQLLEHRSRKELEQRQVPYRQLVCSSLRSAIGNLTLLQSSKWNQLVHQHRVERLVLEEEEARAAILDAVESAERCRIVHDYIIEVEEPTLRALTMNAYQLTRNFGALSACVLQEENNRDVQVLSPEAAQWALLSKVESVESFMRASSLMASYTSNVQMLWCIHHETIALQAQLEERQAIESEWMASRCEDVEQVELEDREESIWRLHLETAQDVVRMHDLYAPWRATARLYNLCEQEASQRITLSHSCFVDLEALHHQGQQRGVELQCYESKMMAFAKVAADLVFLPEFQQGFADPLQREECTERVMAIEEPLERELLMHTPLVVVEPKENPTTADEQQNSYNEPITSKQSIAWLKARLLLRLQLFYERHAPHRLLQDNGAVPTREAEAYSTHQQQKLWEELSAELQVDTTTQVREGQKDLLYVRLTRFYKKYDPKRLREGGTTFSSSICAVTPPATSPAAHRHTTFDESMASSTSMSASTTASPSAALTNQAKRDNAWLSDIVDKYTDKEEELWPALERKYGIEPSSSTESDEETITPELSAAHLLLSTPCGWLTHFSFYGLELNEAAARYSCNAPFTQEVLGAEGLWRSHLVATEHLNCHQDVLCPSLLDEEAICRKELLQAEATKSHSLLLEQVQLLEEATREMLVCQARLLSSLFAVEQEAILGQSRLDTMEEEHAVVEDMLIPRSQMLHLQARMEWVCAQEASKRRKLKRKHKAFVQLAIVHGGSLLVLHREEQQRVKIAKKAIERTEKLFRRCFFDLSSIAAFTSHHQPLSTAHLILQLDQHEESIRKELTSHEEPLELLEPLLMPHVEASETVVHRALLEDAEANAFGQLEHFHDTMMIVHKEELARVALWEDEYIPSFRHNIAEQWAIGFPPLVILAVSISPLEEEGRAKMISREQYIRKQVLETMFFTDLHCLQIDQEEFRVRGVLLDREANERDVMLTEWLHRGSILTLQEHHWTQLKASVSHQHAVLFRIYPQWHSILNEESVQRFAVAATGIFRRDPSSLVTAIGQPSTSTASSARFKSLRFRASANMCGDAKASSSTTSAHQDFLHAQWLQQSVKMGQDTKQYNVHFTLPTRQTSYLEKRRQLMIAGKIRVHCAELRLGATPLHENKARKHRGGDEQQELRQAGVFSSKFASPTTVVGAVLAEQRKLKLRQRIADLRAKEPDAAEKIKTRNQRLLSRLARVMAGYKTRKVIIPFLQRMRQRLMGFGLIWKAKKALQARRRTVLQDEDSRAHEGSAAFTTLWRTHQCLPVIHGFAKCWSSAVYVAKQRQQRQACAAIKLQRHLVAIFNAKRKLQCLREARAVQVQRIELLEKQNQAARTMMSAFVKWRKSAATSSTSGPGSLIQRRSHHAALVRKRELYERKNAAAVTIQSFYKMCKEQHRYASHQKLQRLLDAKERSKKMRTNNCVTIQRWWQHLVRYVLPIAQRVEERKTRKKLRPTKAASAMASLNVSAIQDEEDDGLGIREDLSPSPDPDAPHATTLAGSSKSPHATKTIEIVTEPLQYLGGNEEDETATEPTAHKDRHRPQSAGPLRPSRKDRDPLLNPPLEGHIKFSGSGAPGEAHASMRYGPVNLHTYKRAGGAAWDGLSKMDQQHPVGTTILGSGAWGASKKKANRRPLSASAKRTNTLASGDAGGQQSSSGFAQRIKESTARERQRPMSAGTVRPAHRAATASARGRPAADGNDAVFMADAAPSRVAGDPRNSKLLEDAVHEAVSAWVTKLEGRGRLTNPKGLGLTDCGPHKKPVKMGPRDPLEGFAERERQRRAAQEAVEEARMEQQRLEAAAAAAAARVAAKERGSFGGSFGFASINGPTTPSASTVREASPSAGGGSSQERRSVSPLQ